ncbi:MAG: hypothetical protein R3E53_09845 [Myxococcota bacterium]
MKIDVAVSVPESTRAAIVALIEEAGRKVASVELFDLYRGESIGKGRKSLAFHAAAIGLEGHRREGRAEIPAALREARRRRGRRAPQG